jgi:hypothetical protein
MRETAKQSILARKTAKQAKRVENRNTFSLGVSDLGVIVIRGLGNRFPTGLYYNQIETIVNQWPNIQAFYQANKAKIDAAILNAPNVRKQRKAAQAQNKLSVVK